MFQSVECYLKNISKLLTSFTNLSDCKLKNSTEDKEFLKTTNLEPRKIVISFDVKSLFTSIPINLARECVEVDQKIINFIGIFQVTLNF